MGQRVPTTFPLTRSEERAIKTMRRKIRNKLSDKASRARRQEYVINLESKVTTYQKENKRLRSHIINLEKDRRYVDFDTPMCFRFFCLFLWLFLCDMTN